ncbi:hypothetical protein [Pandoraea sp. SD6-2]|uniref:hypothetical protein n=1 Tax=Pandoraea sp. SD6-2 TaxID=1286093 RepID=UPI0011858AEB|nr:hypothetical protein [Pandoraea sp. SD6-2]
MPAPRATSPDAANMATEKTALSFEEKTGEAPARCGAVQVRNSNARRVAVLCIRAPEHLGNPTRTCRESTSPPHAMRRELSTVFVHKAVDNERGKIAKRLIGMAFSAEAIRRASPQANGPQALPIYPQILCSSLWKSP